MSITFCVVSHHKIVFASHARTFKRPIISSTWSVVNQIDCKQKRYVMEQGVKLQVTYLRFASVKSFGTHEMFSQFFCDCDLFESHLTAWHCGTEKPKWILRIIIGELFDEVFKRKLWFFGALRNFNGCVFIPQLILANLFEAFIFISLFIGLCKLTSRKSKSK